MASGGINRGKQFEEQIRNAFEHIDGVSIDRLLDPMAGYAGVRNICDFIVYKKPFEYYIECKSHHGNTLPFTCITDNQWNGMLEKSKIEGVIAGVMVWFIDKDVTMFIEISELDRLKSTGAKSIRFDSDCGTIISGKKKRVLFDYDMTDFFNRFF